MGIQLLLLTLKNMDQRTLGEEGLIVNFIRLWSVRQSMIAPEDRFVQYKKSVHEDGLFSCNQAIG